MPTYACSICKKQVDYEGGLPRLFPFCSDRCKLIDLGHWFREDYVIETEIPPGNRIGDPSVTDD